MVRDLCQNVGDAYARPCPPSFTPEPWAFSNAYLIQLLAQPAASPLLTDQMLIHDPELRGFVVLYAEDEAHFLADFANAFRRLTLARQRWARIGLDMIHARHSAVC